MKNILMKKLSMLFIGLMLSLSMSSNSMAESYWVHGADNAEEVNGIYGYYGDYDTPKDDYCDPPTPPSECPGVDLYMPVYKKNGGVYYIGYRG